MKFSHSIFRLSIAVTCIAIVIGCNPFTKTSTHSDSEHDHEHSDEHEIGPHGGCIADWGNGDFHIEFAMNHDAREARVFILGSDAKTLTPIPVDKLLLSIRSPRFQIELQPIAEFRKEDGKAAVFQAIDDRFGVVQEFAGIVSGVVEGIPYAGNFSEGAHVH